MAAGSPRSSHTPMPLPSGANNMTDSDGSQSCHAVGSTRGNGTPPTTRSLAIRSRARSIARVTPAIVHGSDQAVRVLASGRTPQCSRSSPESGSDVPTSPETLSGTRLGPCSRRRIDVADNRRADPSHNRVGGKSDHRRRAFTGSAADSALGESVTRAIFRSRSSQLSHGTWTPTAVDQHRPE